MMTRELEDIDHRLGYGERVEISRDELSAIERDFSAIERDFQSTQKEIEELEAYKKQRNLAREIIDGLVECIDDEGVVTAGDKDLLARRIKVAVKFVNNLED